MSSNQGVTPISSETFQGMIRERKIEKRRKVEERRQLDLQRITALKSTKGSHPLERFPKEIWNMILQKVGCDDLGNMRQVHDLFKDLTDDTRVRDILFPHVLKVPHFKQLLQEEHSPEDHEPPSPNYSTLRLVSKSARNVIDKMMEDDLLQRMPAMGTGHETSNKSFKVLRFLLSTDYDDEELLDLALSNFNGANPAKRFFARSLVVGLRDLNSRFAIGNEMEEEMQRKTARDTLNQFSNKVKALLEMIGSQIWDFTFFIEDVNIHVPTASSLHVLLREWTNLMPNLKKFKYKSSSVWGWRTGDNMGSSVYSFPHLEFLENVEFNVHPGHEVSFLLLGSILRANQQITGVSLDLGWKPHPLLPARASDLLKSLDLTSFRASPYGGLEEIMNFNWKLKVISLDLKDVSATMKSIFDRLGHFPTLEKVKLVNVKIPEHGELDYLQLPNLTEFSFSALFIPKLYKVMENDGGIHFLLSLQFLVHCKNLKKLRWVLWSQSQCFKVLRAYMLRHERHEAMVNFRAGLRVLYNCNIWDVFQNLDSVFVGLGNEMLYACSSLSGSDYIPPCRHEYQRKEIGELMSVGGFLSSHKCNSSHPEKCPLKTSYGLL